ncbi:hypothetical protein C8Q77DRAFT_699047 [Trametes polyzona]|nr:hypothetical protein C8Q77DRAFT_699047 [Trametes polyzona]
MVQRRQMHSRMTANYIAHGPRSLSPALQKLDPEQRLRLAKSSQKIGKVLGEMPIIDVIPASPDTESVVLTNQSFDTRPLNVKKKGGKSKKAPPPAPVLRYKLPSTRPAWDLFIADVSENTAAPRKPIPAALNLSSPARTFVENNRLSTFPYGHRTPVTPEYLSPLTPISPLSPIKTPDIHEHRMQTLRRLARMSRAFRDTIIEELAVPSVNVVATPEVQNVKTYLDLYRMSVCPPRRSQILAQGRRRSRSVGGEPQRRSVLSVYSAGARTSFVLPPSTTSTHPSERVSYVLALGSPDSPVPIATPASPSPSRLVDDSPLQQQQSVAQAKAVILGTDAQLMESFRRGFGIRVASRRRTGGSGKTPGTPLSATMPKSPKVPYWVRSAYRNRESLHSAGRRRRAGVSRPPPTPRTMRKERRQGWGGEWRVGKMAAVVEKLKEVESQVKAKAKAETNAQAEPEIEDGQVVEITAESVPTAEGLTVVEETLVKLKEAEEESVLAYLEEDEEAEDPYTGIAEHFVEAL